MPAIGEVIPKCILSGPPRKGYIHARNSVAPLSVSPWLGYKKRLNPNLYAVISVSLEFVSTKLVSLPIQSPSVSDPSPKGTDDSAAHVDKLEPWKTPQGEPYGTILAYAPPTVIVQHMPESITSVFALRLDSVCKMALKEARDSVMRGHALITPGGRHTLLRRSCANYWIEVREGPLAHHDRSSVDVLFRSTARVAGSNDVASF